MTTTEKVIKTKLGLLELGKQLGNVSQACKNSPAFLPAPEANCPMRYS